MFEEEVSQINTHQLPSFAALNSWFILGSIVLTIVWSKRLQKSAALSPRKTNITLQRNEIAALSEHATHLFSWE